MPRKEEPRVANAEGNKPFQNGQLFQIEFSRGIRIEQDQPVTV
jgi:hypothetical protein